MPSDESNGGEGKKPHGKHGFSDEVAEQIKRSILFGTNDEHPPKNGRFKKGQSGNPAGRPKHPDLGLGSRSVNALALREGERLIGVREGDQTRQIPAIKVVLRKQFATAIGGNAYAQKHVVQRHDWAERERRLQTMQQVEFWTAYVEAYREAIADAEANGETPPDRLPHPDDIVIDYETGVKIVGPLNEREVDQLKETLRTRDVLIMQYSLDQREASTPPGSDPLDEPGTSMVFAELINQRIPQRYRLSDTDIRSRLPVH
jgi:hypothetical protein